MELLCNYRALVAKVDEMSARIAAEYAAHISCHRGCDGCCRHLSLSLVEAVALAVACSSRPPEQRAFLRDRARKATAEGTCPLLVDGECVLYADRPIICRTHGLPVRVTEGAEQRIDYCPENFKDLGALPGAAVVDIETLNTILAAVNKLFANAYNSLRENERISIAEALLLDV